MNKVLEFLEKYCEWMAIALGGVFLAWVLWTYILFTPVGVPLPDHTTLVPGNVDDYVKKMHADPLDREIADTTPQMPPPLRIAQQDWTEIMAGTSSQVVTLRPEWIGSRPQDVSFKPKKAAPTVQIRVASLPAVPATKSTFAKAARAFITPVLPPAANAAPVPNKPVLPVANRDVNYVLLTYTISPAAIDAEFKKVNIPPQATTTIVETKLYRQELINGQWVNTAPVPSLPIAAPPMALPAAGAGPDAVVPFRTWAESDQGQTDLMRPPFYQVISGEGPWDPHVDDLAVQAAAAAPPAVVPPVEPPQPPRRGPRRPGVGQPPTEGPPLGMPPTGTPPRRYQHKQGLAQDDARPQNLPELAGLQLAQAAPPPVMPDGGFMGADNPAAPGAAAPAPAGALPPAAFVPAGQPNITAWAYDDTVQEGHTYRYQVVYSIRNPVFEANANIVANPTLAAVFAITGPTNPLDNNAWSEPVTVKPTTEFYLANPNWPPNNVPSNVRIEIFKWANGKWQRQSTTFSPGDRIGTDDGKINFQTTETLVDVRYDERHNRPYVLVMEANGELVERDPTTDRNNPRLTLLRSAATGVPPPAPAGGAAPAAAAQLPPGL